MADKSEKNEWKKSNAQLDAKEFLKNGISETQDSETVLFETEISGPKTSGPETSGPEIETAKKLGTQELAVNLEEETKMKDSFWKGSLLPLALILLAGLLLRITIFCVFDGAKLQIIDEMHYHELAVTLAETGNYASKDVGLFSLRPPLYPWLVSSVYRIWGVENFFAVRSVQVLLSLLTVLCVYGLALETGFLNRRGALWTAGLFSVYPSLAVQNFFLLTETFFTFWLVLVLWSALRFLRTGSLYAISFCGACIALGALTRSILWLSPIPFALFVLFWPNSLEREIESRKKEMDSQNEEAKSPEGKDCSSELENTEKSVFRRVFSWKRRLAGALLLLLFAGVGMAPWIIRNTRVQGVFTPIDCMSGRNLMMGNYEFTPLYRAWDAISMQAPKDWYTVLHAEISKTENYSIHPLSQGKKDQLAGEYAKEYMKNHPVQTLQRTGMKALCFWQLERSIPAGIQSGFWGFDRFEKGTRLGVFAGISLMVLGVYAVIFLGAVWGIFAMEYTSRCLPVLAFLLAVLLYFWVLHSLAFAHERYHLPLVPILILWCVWFGQNWKKALLSLQKKPIRLAAAFLVSGTFLVFWGLEICWAIEIL